MTSELNAFLLGATAATFAAATAFFIGYWKSSRDRLFVLFAFAFAILTVNQVVSLVAGDSVTTHGAVSVVRLAAFMCILVAIVDKNRR